MNKKITEYKKKIQANKKTNMNNSPSPPAPIKNKKTTFLRSLFFFYDAFRSIHRAIDRGCVHGRCFLSFLALLGSLLPLGRELQKKKKKKKKKINRLLSTFAHACTLTHTHTGYYFLIATFFRYLLFLKNLGYLLLVNLFPKHDIHTVLLDPLKKKKKIENK